MGTFSRAKTQLSAIIYSTKTLGGKNGIVSKLVYVLPLCLQKQKRGYRQYVLFANDVILDFQEILLSHI